MIRLVNETMKQYLKLRLRKIERYMQDPAPAQERWLQKLLFTARQTEYGRKHGFKKIRHFDDFTRQVPLNDYESLKGDIHRMMLGESDVLWPGRISWFSKSSGTTSNKSKFIPVPYANLFRSHISGTWDAVALLYANKPDMEIFRRKNLVLPGSYDRFAEYPRTRYGDVSAILTQHMPAIGRAFYTPDFKTSLIHDFEDKICRVAEITSKRDDIVMFGGVPTWLIVLFRMILEKTGKNNMLEVWPHLQAYMHGGVGFAPYRDNFRELIPSDDFAYQEIYNASEGFFGAQCDLDQMDMLLLADNGIYYEFIPMEHWGTENPKTIPLESVEIGKNYAIVISANNGLWRYQPGDTLMFTRKFPHCFRITGRTKQFINAFGEEVMAGDTDKALSRTCAEHNAVVSEYTAAPVYFSGTSSRGGHQWIVEFEKRPRNLEAFTTSLDMHLQQINSDYEAKRYLDLALTEIRLHEVPGGTFHRWMKARGKFGNQNKVPRLANHREYVEQILRISGEPVKE